MAPESVFEKARKQLSCHRGSSILIEDAWRIDTTHYECLAMCSRCKREVYIEITRDEYRQMDNREIWKDR